MHLSHQSNWGIDVYSMVHPVPPIFNTPPETMVQSRRQKHMWDHAMRVFHMNG